MTGVSTTVGPLALPRLPDTVRHGEDPGWSAAARSHRPCPCCGTDASRPICERPDGSVVAKCASCGMVYVPDVPDAAALAELYGRYSAFKGYGGASSWIQRAREAFRSRRDPKLAILEVSGGLRGRTVLEVGASHGRFLRGAARRGAVVAAVEPDRIAARRLAERGIEVLPGAASGRAFDVACCFHVLEHLVEPSDMVRDLAAALRPDGRLLVAVPNGRESEILGEGWVGFRVDLEHLNFFDARSMARLLRRHGLYVEHYWEGSQPILDRAGTRPSGLRGLAGAVRRRVRGAHDALAHGTYELTMLARKL